MSISGLISGSGADAVLLGARSSLVISETGLVETTSNHFGFAPAIGVMGALTNISVDGTVRTSGNSSAAIATGSNGLFGTSYYGSSITVGQTGVVSTSGASSAAIQLAGGSDLQIAGQVAAIGSGSDAISYMAGPGQTVSIDLQASGSIASSQGAAITGTGTAAILKIAGSVTGGAGAAIALGSGNDTLTLFSSARISGTVDGGAGTDALILAGAGPGALNAVSHFETLDVQSGIWTTAALNFSGGVAIESGASLESQNGANGLTGVTTPSIVDNGTLVVRSSAASAGSTFGSTVVTGSGDILLTGAGKVTLDGVNSIQTTGMTTIDAGATALISGTQGGNFATNTGGTLQIGTGGTTGTFTGNLVDNGALVVDRSDGTTFGGSLSGNGTLLKRGAGELVFAAGYALNGVMTIQDGSIRLSAPMAPTIQLDVEGAGQLNLAGTNQSVASLSGTNTSTTINIAGGSLTTTQTSDTTFAGAVIGSGSLTKSGSGRLNLSGTNSYTGTTTINGGTLSVNGSIVSPVVVASGGTLGGTGRVGSTIVQSGGVWAPGNSIGTQAVTGNVTFAAGSTYAVEANAAGQSDRIDATGTATLQGGTVRVLAATGTYSNLTNYVILTAPGGVSGQFASVTSNLAFLTPLLNYSANAVTLTLARNDVNFAAIASNDNQRSVAAAVQSRGLGNPLYNYVLMQDASGAQAAFTSLSGEIHASVPTSLLDEVNEVGRVVRNRATFDGEGVGVWGQAMYNLAESAARDGVAPTRTDRRGGIAGIDYGHEGLRAGIAGGYLRSNIGATGRASQADIDSKIVTAYAGYTRDALMLDGGISYTWHDIHTRRTVSLGTIGGLTTAQYDADSAQLFGQAAYAISYRGASFAPFAGYSHLRTHRDGFAESGTVAALTVSGTTRNIDVAELGLKIYGAAPIGGATLLPKLSISYQHMWGNILGIEHATFAGAGSAFSITGASTGKDALRVEGGADIVAGHGFRIGGSAFGQTSGALGDYGARVSLSYNF
ncbi:autotransporter domain-containing protein [Sphingomonas sp. MMS24-J13]|uniref:autotransporter outer membrane beta-barrel domain-containing protein n=1 Tax=Sphingomonas sp. MMS24-J13 TaxID=3238686 RepID=UPI00384B7882